MSHHLLARSSRSGPRLAALAVTALALAPAAASASLPPDVAPPAEVVSRADGISGSAPLFEFRGRTPGAISSNGRYAAFSLAAGTPGEPGYHRSFFLRDVQENRTTEVVHDGASVPTSIDRSDRYVAFWSDQPVTADDTDATPDLFLIDVRNGRKTLVSRASGGKGAPGTATDGRISGDGGSVVFVGTVPGLGKGVFRRDLRTNRTLKIAQAIATGLGERLTSISDDGQTVATTTPRQDETTVLGRVITNGKPQVIASGGAVVSPDGSTAAWVDRTPNADGRPELVVRTLATGAATRTALPLPTTVVNDWFNPEYAGVLWISPGGDQISVAPGAILTTYYAPEPILWTRSTGAFAPIGNQFAGGLRAGEYEPLAAVSRNGKYGLLFDSRFISGLWAVGLNGAPLPGGTDPAPAGEYIQSAAFGCDYAHPGRFQYNALGRFAGDWTQGAQSVRLQFSIDGTQLADVTAKIGQPLTPLSLEDLDLSAAKEYTLRVEVVTSTGETLRDAWTKPVVPPYDQC